nr:immunoglobulin light chain junction region [Macaca mulatta]
CSTGDSSLSTLF